MIGFSGTSGPMELSARGALTPSSGGGTCVCPLKANPIVWMQCIFDRVSDCRATDLTDEGLRTPNETFSHRNPKLLGLDRQFGQVNFGVFGVFLANLSAPILVLWVLGPRFPSINHYFYKKLVFISQSQTFIWDWDLNLGHKELGIQPSCVRGPCDGRRDKKMNNRRQNMSSS